MAGRVCQVCQRADREDIENDILNKAPLRTIERQRHIGRKSLTNHRDKCMGGIPAAVQADPRVVVAREEAVAVVVENLSTGERIRNRYNELTGKVDNLLASAEAEQNDGKQIAAIREARALLADEAKVLLQILGMTQDKTVLDELPEFREVIARILIALEPYPQARQAAAEALNGV